MKKAIISVISVLCVGLMVVGPLREAYANNSNKEEQKTSEVVATNTNIKTDKNETDKVKEQATEATEKQDTTEVKTDNQTQDAVAKKENVAVNTTATEQKQPQATTQPTTNVVNKEEPKAEESQTVVEQKTTLTQSQALQLVKAYEPGVAGYDYMGDENTYTCIKEKGIQGYVFLPQCDGDMAYLVDKNSGHIYFFHPSGYFELLK